MKAEKYLKILKRMCNTYETCSDCPNYDVACCSYYDMDIEKEMELVDKWDKEHPVKTTLSEFLKMFPNAEMQQDSQTNEYFIDICVKRLDKTIECVETQVECIEVCNKCKKEFWNQEVE